MLKTVWILSSFQAGSAKLLYYRVRHLFHHIFPDQLVLDRLIFAFVLLWLRSASHFRHDDYSADLYLRLAVQKVNPVTLLCSDIQGPWDLPKVMQYTTIE